MIRKAQVFQNQAARWVTGCSKRTRILTLLQKTGWFSITEMARISTATQIWKIINKRDPKKTI